MWCSTSKKGKLFKYKTSTPRYGIVLDDKPNEYAPGWVKVMWNDDGKIGRASLSLIEIIN